MVTDMAVDTLVGLLLVTLKINDNYSHQNSNWLHSKKLLPGSLCVLTSSKNLDDMYSAIVRVRDGKKMSKTARNFGYIEI